MMVHVAHQTEAAVRHYGAVKGLETAVEQLSEQFGKEKVMATLGDGVKRLAPAELANYERTNRSLHYMKALKAGETVQAENIGILRTEKVLSVGVGPELYDLLVGKKLARDVEDGAGVRLEDFLN